MVQSPPIIVFADRETAWSESLRIELQRRGARVFTAQSQRELLEMVDRSAPDVVVLSSDFDESGPDALVALVRERAPRAALALLASPPLQPLEKIVRALGLVYYGERPADSRALLDVIADALPGRIAERERPRRPALVMCVDDDPLYLQSLERILTHHGYRAALFADPEQALDAVADLKPDLAIIDIMMPGMNGLNLADEIRESYGGRVPVVMLTARGADTDILDGYRHGIAYYITKPCAPRTILNIVDYLVGGLDKSQREKLEMEL